MSTHHKLSVLNVQCYETELTKLTIVPDTFEPNLGLQSITQPYENLFTVTGQN
ncbi:hypothetical protein BGZ96_004542 [Linnemannia gamsii]|uniref:Uncharacterized protein n=1 Tax=Linnemannia gamsii TaxID=64522 RepID=A0ABQ7JI25_9FUNG|nr:hypothetical protein BGZ96_004542 [Linnemannia gamsii]